MTSSEAAFLKNAASARTKFSAPNNSKSPYRKVSRGKKCLFFGLKLYLYITEHNMYVLHCSLLLAAMMIALNSLFKNESSKFVDVIISYISAMTVNIEQIT